MNAECELARAETLPAAWYHDPETYERERQGIFAREWHLVGHTGDLNARGAYVATEIAGWPIFVIRGRDDSLAGFHNVCRHRGAPLVWEEAGRCELLRCRYHGQVYDLAGNLREAPDFGAAADFDLADYPLFGICVDIWRGLVFVNLDLEAPSLADALGGLASEVADTEIERFQFHSRLAFEFDANWKTWVENILEGYHGPTLHPGVAHEIKSGEYRVHIRDEYCRSEVPATDSDDVSGFFSTWLCRYPGTALNIFENGMSAESILPSGPGRTRVVYYHFFRDTEPGTTTAIEDGLARTRRTTEEDIEMCERVQRNLRAGIYDTGRLSPKHENGVWYFQNLVHKSLRE